MKRELILTNDGSSTIRIHDLNENYHSGHGAIQEALHVFIKNGLSTVNGSTDLTIRIFEMGFGTGLNALLSYQYAIQNNIKTIYSGIEAYPIEKELYSNLNYVDKVGDEFTDFFNWMHASPWGVKQQFDDHFTLNKIHMDLSDFIPETSTFDLVFYDAFGPRAQSEMWELGMLEKNVLAFKSKGQIDYLLRTRSIQKKFKTNRIRRNCFAWASWEERDDNSN